MTYKRTITIDREKVLNLAVKFLLASQATPTIIDIAEALGVDRRRIYEKLDEIKKEEHEQK